MMRHSIRAASAVLSAFLLFSLAGCSSGSEPSNNIGTQYADKAYGFQLEAPAAGEQVAVMHTSKGDITLRFFPEAAPKAVQNFKEHAEKGYYDGLLFHRVIQDFMIQGGDPKGNGTGGESIFGSKFEDEFDQKLLNLTGAVSMANSGPNTNGSQFFIVTADSVDPGLLGQMREAQWPADVIAQYESSGGTPWLDFRHTVFGQVVRGLDVAMRIAAVEKDALDMPRTPVRIESVEILAR